MTDNENGFIDSSELVKTPLSEIKVIAQTSGLVFRERKEIKELVEPPLVSACEMLYDKNIETWGSSANEKDVRVGWAYIAINRASLSEENRHIYDELPIENKEVDDEFGPPKDEDDMFIYFPTKSDTTAGDIEQASVKVASGFKKQPMIWAPRMTLDDLRKTYRISPEEDISVEDFIGESGYYYDESSQMFFMSQEHFDKFVNSTAVGEE